MKYTSTRSPAIVTSFEEAICSGYANDGGLFVPVNIPVINEEVLKFWSTLGYVDLSYEVFRRFIGEEEVPDENLRELCEAAYAGFKIPSHAVPVIEIGSIFVAELFHGPTFCFKDLGLRVTIGLLSYFATKRNRKITLLVSTTGDTGPAAVQAVADLENPLLTILVHYPEGQISQFQRKQMTCIESKVVRVVAFQGGGDDMDKPIKNMLTKYNESMETQLTGVNSYNFARPMAQLVHHVWTYLRVIEKLGRKVGDPIDIILPTGAMGNLSAGEIARQMGLPIRKYCAVVNVNDITHRAFQTGRFHKSPKMIRTLSEAINIQIPYNFERLLFYLTGSNHELVNKWMATLEETSKLDLEEVWLEKIQRQFDSARITDEEMCETMREVWTKFQYFSDPHTAVAMAGAKKMGYFLDDDDDKSMIPAALLATASPCKFEKAVTEALGNAGWQFYVDSSFPVEASTIIEKKEIKPFIYEADASESLVDKQIRWETQALSIVATLSKIG